MSNWKSWVLTDAQTDVSVETWNVTSRDVGQRFPRPWSVQKRRLHVGLSNGVELVEVDNGELRYVIVPTRGMGIWRGEYRGTALGWKSPVRGPVHPAFVNEQALGGLGWITGFDEWVVRCGLSSNGPPGTDVVTDNHGNRREIPLTLHGRIANLPAHYLEVRVNLAPPHEIEVIGEIAESVLFFPQLLLRSVLRTTPGSARLTIHDLVTNLHSQPGELELLYHCNFGPPLLSEGSRLLAPARSVAPRDTAAEPGLDGYDRFTGPTPGVTEAVYYIDLLADSATGWTVAGLVDAAGTTACALRFPKAQLPWFILWKNPGAECDGYVTGLEPATNLPNRKRFERENGRVISLPPGGSYETELVLEMADGKESVAALATEIARIQSTAAPTIHRMPQPRLSPTA